MWWPNKNGVYSVKSAYHTCMERMVNKDHLKVSGDWNSIWKLVVPPKVKNCLRHACKDWLPTRICLQSREVQCSMTCVNREQIWRILPIFSSLALGALSAGGRRNLADNRVVLIAGG